MRRSRHDREILRLAVPALGALAAEPVYLLVDTAIVGHLGTRELAALALAATVLTTLVSLCIFLDRAEALWPLFAALWPVAAAVFALDGILIGAGDTRFLVAAMAASAAVYAPLVLLLNAGVVGVWAALNVLMAVRLVTTGARFARRRWVLVGAPA